MDRLYKGIQKFQQTFYKREEEFFRRVGKTQSPDVLFFTCSDARVDPNLITQSKPGELFIVKNVGNIVPPNEPMRKKTCTAAAIEFALLKLNVTDIVVCGHSDCAALKALWYDEKEFRGMPNLRDWINTASDVKETVIKHNHATSYDAKMEMTEKSYLVTQLRNLKTYPLIAEALREEKIRLHGWYYDICSGMVYSYNQKTNSFEKIECGEKDLDGVSPEEGCEDLQ
ncbi:MAG TPA: carbonic anhydrase [Deltaproteobacteria bacterium]|nr:MAG: hypothetical protein A2Z79_04395 [Deltaproteobacteria bacterium GWA2_55_82]OGQ64164.1 MAG: hypothetical protein A3I81_10780 [Deltaproteobacteria bacterium RIFCSPLOWO2_02_FULL_55_12]OIJ74617.1 MAG: hypothetical protein A2V21_310305 [Deltaproteobacteria bacterium GWC2_55_46]HBG46439.1 carbonic anhydrase [Deltaproteobacteria bacterium]HCY10651.1 carbonic anhydrase [Deltaproteobacteria bacterium]